MPSDNAELQRKVEIYQELERRGELGRLPPEKQAAWQELKARGAVGQSEQSPAKVEQPQQIQQEQPAQSGGFNPLDYIPGVQLGKGILNTVGGIASGENSASDLLQYHPAVIAGESAMAMGSGIAGQVAGGIAGAGTAVAEGGVAGGQKVQDVSQGMTYQPKGEGAQAAMKNLEYLGRGIHFLENLMGSGAEEIARGFGADVGSTASGAAYAAGSAVPTALSFMVPGAQGAKATKTQARMAESAAPQTGEAAIREMAGSVQKAESAPTGSGQRAAAMEDLAARIEPQQEIVQAFEEAGIPASSVPAEVLSGSVEYRQLAGGARSVPASPSNVRYREFQSDVARRVEDMSAEAGALPRDAINENVRSQLLQNVSDATEASRAAWGQLDDAVSPSTAVDAAPIKQAIEQRIEALGGDASRLSSLEKKLYGDLSGDAPITWEYLSDIRKNMNAARAGQGVFKDAAGHELEKYARLVSGTQGQRAEGLGFGEQFRSAMQSTGVKKTAQETAQKLLGKNLDQSFSLKMDTAFNDLAKGRTDKFRSTMESLPDDAARKEVATSYLYDRVLKTSDMDTRLNTAKFNTFFNELGANPKAKAELYKHLDPAARKDFDNIGKMVSAIKRANEDAIKTGLIDSLDQGFKLADSVVGRIGKLAATRFIPGGGAISELAGSAVAKSNRKLSQAASDLMASPEYQSYVTAQIAKKPGAEQALARSSAWRKFVATAPKEVKQDIAKLGVTGWIQSGDGKQQEK